MTELEEILEKIKLKYSVGLEEDRLFVIKVLTNLYDEPISTW